MPKYYEYFYGNKVSDYALEHGYLDYRTLAKCFDCVLCNQITSADENLFENLESGEMEEFYNEEGDEITHEEYEQLEEEGKECESRFKDFYQYYIVSDNAIELLKEANETVFYSNLLDCYVWAVSHYGTSWDYVLTNIKLEEVRE